ncbi:hypothetical protein H5410_031087, partial [Solanum commersonii]
IYVIFGHFQTVTKRSKFLSFIRPDILGSLVQAKLFLRRFYIVYVIGVSQIFLRRCVFFLFFWPSSDIYVILGHFWTVTK